MMKMNKKVIYGMYLDYLSRLSCSNFETADIDSRATNTQRLNAIPDVIYVIEYESAKKVPFGNFM